MSIARRRATFFGVVAIVLLEVFQCGVGLVVLFVFGGRTSGVERVMLFVPFLSLPILILAVRKLGMAMRLMWILFCISHAWYTKISWPKWEAIYMMLKLDWPLLAICILLTLSLHRSPAISTSNA
jgi:hypothetical protein